jgi:hypothetical protein
VVTCPGGSSSCQANEDVTAEIDAPNTPTGKRRSSVAHALRVGSASFTIPAGGSVEATFVLNQLGRILRSDHKHLRLQVTITGQAQGQTPVTATKAITLDGRFAHSGVTRIEVHRDGTITFQANVSAPGRFNVLLSAWKDNKAGVARVLNPARERFVVAQGSFQANKPGTLKLTLHPNANGRRLITHPAYPVTLRLWVSYIPLDAFQTDTGYYGLHLGYGCTPCHERTWP